FLCFQLALQLRILCIELERNVVGTLAQAVGTALWSCLYALERTAAVNKYLFYEELAVFGTRSRFLLEISDGRAKQLFQRLGSILTGKLQHIERFVHIKPT